MTQTTDVYYEVQFMSDGIPWGKICIDTTLEKARESLSEDKEFFNYGGLKAYRIIKVETVRTIVE